MRPLTARRGPAGLPERAPVAAAPRAASAFAGRKGATGPVRDMPHDPAPSVWSYRVQRLWLTPMFRTVLRVGLPGAALVLACAVYFGDADRRAAIAAAVAEVREEIESRPEFRVNVMGVTGASDAVIAEIRAAAALELPVSSFDLDLADLRTRIEALPAVASADLRIQSGGYLAVRVEERVPAMIWQTREGAVLIDAEGHFVAPLGARPLEAPLPAMAGDGADIAVAEALALQAAAAPLGDLLRGLVRMGERRWDVVLTDGRRILLPADRPVQALDRALALNDVTDILARDVLRLDLRNPDRLTVQLTPAAAEDLHALPVLARPIQTPNLSPTPTQLQPGERRG